MKRSAFITGASKGTGFAIARRFAGEGYEVFIGSRSEASACAAAKRSRKNTASLRGVMG